MAKFDLEEAVASAKIMRLTGKGSCSYYKENIKNGKNLDYSCNVILLVNNIAVEEIEEMTIEEKVAYIHLFGD